VSTRHLLSLADLSAAEMLALLQRAAELATIQRSGGAVDPLRGKSLAMIFEKSSTRTRVSFEVGAHQLGGHGIMLSPTDMQMGRGESISDTAQVLSRYVDGIMIRTFGHDKLMELAKHATVPVINGLTDLLHPCQILADLLTCRDEFGAAALTGLTVAWIGDGNNMAHSWINAAGVLGFQLNLACPEGYDPDPAIMAAAGSQVKLFRSPAAAAAGADVVTTDVWASMGQEDEAKKRIIAFAGFMVDEAVMAEAKPSAIFLHCLPAHRGEEASAAVVDGPQSRIFDEAENRLHAQKAVMEWLMGGRALDLA
jgi:ornithine carbamoyltransferase